MGRLSEEVTSARTLRMISAAREASMALRDIFMLAMNSPTMETPPSAKMAMATRISVSVKPLFDLRMGVPWARYFLG